MTMTNLSYETAKKLKDAGFPQKRGVYGNPLICPHDKFGVHHSTCSEVAVIPTLTELIEACKSGFFSLQRYGSEEKGITWTSNDVQVWYPTPEDAVAELWLELNTK